jgi:hypothetical protein
MSQVPQEAPTASDAPTSNSAEVEALRREIEELKAKQAIYEAQQSEAAIWKEQTESLKSQLDAFKRNAENSRIVEKAKFDSEVDELKTEIKALRATSHGATENLQDMLASKERLIDDLRSQLAAAQAVSRLAHEQDRESSANSSALLDEQRAQLDAERHKLDEERRAFHREVEQRRVEDEKEFRFEREKILDLENKLKEERAEIETLDAESRKQAETEQVRLDALFKSLEQERAALQEEREAFLASQLKEREELKRAHEKLVAQVRQDKEDSQAALEVDQRKAKHELQVETERLEAQRSQVAARETAVTSANSDLEADREKLEAIQAEMVQKSNAAVEAAEAEAAEKKRIQEELLAAEAAKAQAALEEAEALRKKAAEEQVRIPLLTGLTIRLSYNVALFLTLSPTGCFGSTKVGGGSRSRKSCSSEKAPRRGCRC